MPALAHAPGCVGAEPGKASLVAMPGTGRSLLLYLPLRISAKQPAPLVLLLHGSGGNGREILEHSHLRETADRNGFIIAVPDGGIALARGFVWNIPGVPSVSGQMPTQGDADDVAFLGKAIDHLVADRCAAPDQVFVTGISGGGRMASWLACVDAGRIAAIAPVVGLRAGNPLGDDRTRPDPATCRPSRPMPILAFAGDADRTNPITGGGSRYWQYSMRAAEARWAELNGCRSAVPSRPVVGDGIYEEGFTGCRQGADVLARVTIGGTHDWVADNEVLWAFFAAHRRHPAPRTH
ncbi:polyhydroxybutyrate depolymerase [Sphingomonas sp. R-74633]|nr:polyhydroxybutyrate depolymerase [Sphingomonas sp. R-74633]